MIRLRQTFGTHAGRELELDQMRIRIGRVPENDIAFAGELDLDASGFHAEIFWLDDRYSITDLGSRNGTYVNGERVVGARELEEGDRIEFGRGGPRLEVDFIGDASGRRPPSLRPDPRREMPMTRRPGDPGSLVGHSEHPARGSRGELVRLFHALFPSRRDGPRISGLHNLQVTGLGFAFVLFVCVAALVVAYLLL